MSAEVEARGKSVGGNASDEESRRLRANLSVSIFAKPLSQITTADLKELLDESAAENVRLEFKAEAPSKDEILKKISSFANTFGGYVIIGASARSVDGRVESLRGIDPKPGYKQTIVQWCSDGATPPLTIEVSDPIQTPDNSDKVCYVVHVAESDVAPHFLNGRKGVYVRADEFSARFEARLADESELRHLFDRRKLILERRTNLLHRARMRFQRYAFRRTQELAARVNTGEEQKRLGANLSLCVVPRFPAKPIVEQAKLKPLIQRTALRWRQVTFPRLNDPIISQHESVIVLHPEAEFSLLEANIWGMLFYATDLEVEGRGAPGIHLYHLAGCILAFLCHANQVLRSVGYSGPLVIEISLSSILGVNWVFAPRGFVETKDGSKLDEEAAFSVETSTDALNEKQDSVAIEILQCVCFCINWSELVDSPEKLEELVRAGYRYNFWNAPDRLRL